MLNFSDRFSHSFLHVYLVFTFYIEPEIAGCDYKGSYILTAIFYSLYFVLLDLTVFVVFCLPSERPWIAA